MSELDTTLCMERAHLRDIPKPAMPSGYAIRAYHPGDAPTWTVIQRAADLFNTFTERTFDEQFPADEPVRERRIFFATAGDGQPVGTVATWYAEGGPAGPCGLVHWFAVLPAHQRRGIGRALLAHSLHAMAAMHQRARLCTDSNRLEAVKLYQEFGFTRSPSGS